MKIELTVIIVQMLIQISNQNCIRQSNNLNYLLKRNHQNVLSYQSGALISSKNRWIYKTRPVGAPYTSCGLGKQISITLLQKYLLNTLKIWFWDYDFLYNESTRHFDIVVYAKLDQGKNKIYENKFAISLMTIEFDDQFVEEFQVVNVGGNTHNGNLNIIKVEAYYKFS
ncbi:unnamed protein product [Paramecium pentaurelia]|uniref:Uncharacterized protein n=1 Tax=Paramecium pentaurelia TaxID=43138 RepID=A0A8S1WYG4_9CILI|nr:unnamed protein product [Paramecium pentaurelia]